MISIVYSLTFTTRLRRYGSSYTAIWSYELKIIFKNEKLDYERLVETIKILRLGLYIANIEVVQFSFTNRMLNPWNVFTNVARPDLEVTP